MLFLLPVESKYTLVTPSGSSPGSGSTSIPSLPSFPEFIGKGLITPFLRASNDIQNSDSIDVIQSNISQILGTRKNDEVKAGELPWRDDFGSLLYELRHVQNDVIAQELAKVHVIDAISRWEPRVRIKRVFLDRVKDKENNETILEIKILYDIVSTNPNRNNVIVPDVNQTIFTS